MEKKLYKSSTNKIIFGVCGGLGEYFDIDPMIVRVGFIVGAFFLGGGLLAYPICALVIPQKPMV